MVETDNQMTMDDFERIIQDNPPGTPAPIDDNTPGTGAQPAPDTQQQQQQQQQSTTTPNADPVQTQIQQQTDNQAGGSDQSQQTENQKRSANETFAAMRIQNKKVTNALAAVLRQHGLDPNLANDPDALLQQAEQARIEEEAKKQNVPVDLLQRLTQLENRDRENQQKRLTDAALAGFQAVKDQFGLDAQGISEFARQLQEAGTNPFEQEMDLVQHYKMHNLDKIIALETQKAVEAALKNQKASTQFSTTPSKTQGKESTGTEQIDTMAKFDRFLMGIK